jgi:prolyl-tRNA synthetase
MATSTNKISINRKEAARRLAAMLEEHMDEQGLSEAQKNAKVAKFAKNVDKATSAAVLKNGEHSLESRMVSFYLKV